MDDIAYGDFKDFPKRTTSDQVLCDKTFKIASSPQYDRYQRGLVSVVYKFFDDPTHSGMEFGFLIINNRPMNYISSSLESLKSTS